MWRRLPVRCTQRAHRRWSRRRSSGEPLLVSQRPLEQQDDLFFGQRLENVNPAAGEQRRYDLEGGIFRGRADQADVALLHVRQESILLRLIEAVNLVDENDGARAVLPRPLGVGHHLLDFLDPSEDGGELDELRLGHVRDDLRQRGFARARRAPENQRARIVALDLRVQRLARSDEVLLPDKFVQRARTHAIRQRTGAIAGVLRARSCLEQAHGTQFTTETRRHGEFKS